MNINQQLNKAQQYIQKKDLKQALLCLDKITKKFPMQPLALQQQAQIYLQLKKNDFAEIALQKLSTISFNKNVIQNLIILKYELNKLDEAEDFIKKILQNDANNYIGLLYQAKIARTRKDYVLAEQKYQLMLKIYTQDVLVHINYGYLLNEMEAYEKAIEIYKQGEKLTDQNPGLYYNMGVAYLNMEEDTNAELCFKRTIQLGIKSIDPYINLSSIYFRRSDLKSSKEIINQALQLEPDNPLAINQLALNNTYEGNYEISEALYKKAVKLEPNYVKANYGLSMNLLMQKKFNEFKTYYRWRTRDLDNIKSFQNIFDDFDIESIKDYEKILFYYEQGIGDQLFFSRFLKKINKEIILVSSPKTKLFFEKNLKNIRVIDKLEYENIYKNDDQYLRINLASVIRFIEEKDIIETRNEIYQAYENKDKKIAKQDNYRIGISWKSRIDQFGKSKAFPLNEIFSNLQNNTNKDFINLQYGEVQDELDHIKNKHKISILNYKEFDITNEINDLANLIMSCDLVITCSNVTAHVAGLLGKKTILILPKYYGRLWFWDQDKTKNSFWYPSIKIIENENNEWSKIFTRINSEIDKYQNEI